MCSYHLATDLGRDCRGSVCSLGFDLQLSDSVSRQASTIDPTAFPAATLKSGGSGMGAGCKEGHASHTRQSSLPAQRAEQKVRQNFPNKLISSVGFLPWSYSVLSKNVFWYETKIFWTVGAKSDASQYNAVGASLSFPRLVCGEPYTSQCYMQSLLHLALTCLFDILMKSYSVV